MKNEIQKYEIRSDPHQELHLQFSPDLFRHRHVATGDRRSPAVKEKGILVEWLVHSQKEYNDTIVESADRHTYTGFRITYTYHEPLLFSNYEQ